MLLGKLRSMAMISPVLAMLLCNYGCSSAAGLASQAASSSAATTSPATTPTTTSSSTSGGSLALAEPATANTSVSQIRLALLNEAACQSDAGQGSGSGSGKDHHHPEDKGGNYRPGSMGPMGPMGHMGPGQGQGSLASSQTASSLASALSSVDFTDVQSILQLVLSEISAASSSGTAATATTASTTTATASLDDTTVTSAASGTVASTASSACLVKNVTQSYTAGSNITVSGIPDGTYTLMVDLEDANGNALEAGSTSVTITTGQTASAAVTLETVQAGSLAVSVTQAPATQLVFLTSALSQTTAACGAVTIEAQDANKVLALLASSLSINLTSSSSTGLFYSDAACTTAITAVSIAAGAADATFYYQDATAGSPTLTVADPTSGGLASGTLGVTVTAN